MEGGQTQLKEFSAWLFLWVLLKYSRIHKAVDAQVSCFTALGTYYLTQVNGRWNLENNIYQYTIKMGALDPKDPATYVYLQHIQP